VKKIVLCTMSTITVLVLLFGYHTSTSSRMAPARSAVAPAAQGGSAGSGQATGQSGPPSATTVTGTSASTRWGPVQVRIAVAGRTVTDVTVVEYPANNRRDEQINARALPILVRETLAAQSARIDMVSGATVTSEGYLSSLQSALDQAGL
jgi:uncharacterized protein with FMN-binding domain